MVGKWSDKDLLSEFGKRLGDGLDQMRESRIREFVFVCPQAVKGLEVICLSTRMATTIDLNEGDKLELYNIESCYEVNTYQATFLLKLESGDYAIKVSCEHADVWTGNKWHELLEKAFNYSDLNRNQNTQGYGDWS